MNDIIAEDYSVTIVSTTENVALVNIQNIRFSVFSKLLSLLGEERVNLDMISQNKGDGLLVNISFSIELSDVEKAEQIIKSVVNDNYTILKNVGKLNVEGAGMEHKYGVAASVTEILTSNDIFVNAITTSETKISVCVSMENLNKAQALLKDYFKVNI